VENTNILWIIWMDILLQLLKWNTNPEKCGNGQIPPIAFTTHIKY
jgi:hypothetical protein